MKLNNKGLTVIELILCFVLLIILVFGMFNVVLDVKDYSETKELEKELISFKNRIIYMVQDDLISKGLKNTSVSCPSSYEKKYSTKCLKITFNDNEVKYLIIEPSSKIINYGTVSSLESYKIPNSNVIEFLDETNIGLCTNKNNTNNKNSYKNKTDCENNGFTWIGNFDTYQNITFTNKNNVLIIDVPYYEIDGTTNYGFKIIHPYDLD